MFLKNRYCHGELEGATDKAGMRGRRNLFYRTGDAPSSGGYLENSLKIQPRTRAMWARVGLSLGRQEKVSVHGCQTRPRFETPVSPLRL